MMKKNRRCSAFTLLEVLMVVLVIGILSSVLVPYTFSVVEGSRLRESLEKIISINKYARARALLDSQPVALLYHGDTGRLELLQLPVLEAPPDTAFMSNPPPRFEEEGLAPSESTSGLAVLKKVSLAKGITLKDVRGAERENNTWFVTYTVGGMTNPHTVEVEDGNGVVTKIIVNGITGEVSIGN
jgi:prepilin-type N-terminal cleavage/methylation domain-containing protein